MGNASDLFSGNQQMGCSNACYMRDSGVSKSECKSHCDRHKDSGCSLTVEGVDFNLCYPYFVRGDSCGSPRDWECELGCESYGETSTAPTGEPTALPTNEPTATPSAPTTDCLPGTARPVHLDFTRSELRLNASRVPKTPTPSLKEHRSAPLVRRALTPQETQLPVCVCQWKLMSQSLENSLPLMNAETCARRKLVKKMPVTFKVGSINSAVAMPATCETAVCQRTSARATAIAILVVDVLLPSKALILLCVRH